MTRPWHARITEAQLALMLLTRLPAGRLRDPAPKLADAAWAFPLVGLVTGTLGWASQQAALALGLGPLVSAMLAVLVLALVTGALHLDGLADFADGIGGGRDRAQCLEIMRDSRIGSYGVVALVLALGLKAAALAEFDRGAPLPVFLFAALGSRLAMTALLVGMPPARPDGLGHEAAGGMSRRALLPGALLLAAIGSWLGLGAVLALAAMVLVGGLIARAAWRRLGGHTGDVLGAVQLTTGIAALIALTQA